MTDTPSKHTGRRPKILLWREPDPDNEGAFRWKEDSPIQAFLDSVTAGNTIEDAAGSTPGICKTSVFAWQTKGLADRAARRRTVYREFAESLERAKHDSIARLVLVVANDATANPSSAMWMLSRRDPDRWGSRLAVDQQQIPAAPVVAPEPTPEQKALETRLGKDLAAEVADIDAWVAELKPRRADPGVAGTILRLKERRDRLLGMTAPGAPGGAGGAAAGVAVGLGEFLARAFPENQPGYDPAGAAVAPPEPGGLDAPVPVEQ